MQMRFFRTVPWLLVVLAWMAARTACAHQAGLSTVFVDLSTNQITAQIIVFWQELEGTIPLDGNHDRALSDAEFSGARARLLKLGETALSLESDGRMLALTSPVQVQRDDTNGVHFTLAFESIPTRVLTITSDIIADLQPGHSQIVTVRSASGTALGEAVLQRDKPSVDVPLFALKEKTPVSAARQFLILGLEHILTGWDHLAFLFGLLAVGGKLRDAVKIITSFTIAHSLSLALATLNIVNIPSHIVEPLIAVSIIYVGFENIVRTHFDRRWMLTFAFGLVHGCGFASALRELGLGSNGSSVVTPLVCFNLGVEIGQLAIAAVILPLIWKLKVVFPKRWIPVTAVGLVLVGSYFLTERLWPRPPLSRPDQAAAVFKIRCTARSSSSSGSTLLT